MEGPGDTGKKTGKSHLVAAIPRLRGGSASTIAMTPDVSQVLSMQQDECSCWDDPPSPDAIKKMLLKLLIVAQ